MERVTIQQLAAFVVLLTQGAPREVLAACDNEGLIRTAFNENRLLYLEVGGLDFTPALVDLYIASYNAVNSGNVPGWDVLSAHGFFGVYAYWFWSKIAKSGEEGFFKEDTVIANKELAEFLNRDDVLGGWMISFITGALRESYRNNLSSRREVEMRMAREPSTKPIYPLLARFKP